MAKVVPIRSVSKRTNDIYRAWHRSFPPETIEGSQWMLTVLDDLIAFSQDKSLNEVEAELRSARDRIIPRLPHGPDLT